MTRGSEGSFDAYLPAERVLSQAEIGVIVTDRQSNILFANEYVSRLMRLAAPAAKFVRQPLHVLGFIPDGDLPKAADLSRQVLSGMTWEGTFTGARGDSTLVFLRVLAVPLRHASGDIDGMVIMVTEAGRRDAQRSRTGCACSSGSASGWPVPWSSTPRCGTSLRSWFRSSPTTASST
jgi:PAS domain-containing protein